MHPTGPEQLRGVRRQLASLTVEVAGAAELRAVLADAGRILERLEASWPARLPFLLADNAATEVLLARLGVALPAAGLPGDTPVDGPEDAAHERNKALRARLADLVAALPPPPEAADVRREVARHLRRRLAADPSLHRRPRPYGPEPGDPEPAGPGPDGHAPDGAT